MRAEATELLIIERRSVGTALGAERETATTGVQYVRQICQPTLQATATDNGSTWISHYAPFVFSVCSSVANFFEKGLID